MSNVLLADAASPGGVSTIVSLIGPEPL